MRQHDLADSWTVQPRLTLRPTCKPLRDGHLSNLSNLLRRHVIGGGVSLQVNKNRLDRLDRLDRPSSGAGFGLPNLFSNGWAGWTTAFHGNPRTAVAESDLNVFAGPSQGVACTGNSGRDFALFTDLPKGVK